MAGGAGVDIWRMGTNVNCSFLARRGHPSIYPHLFMRFNASSRIVIGPGRGNWNNTGVTKDNNK